jgi:flavin reductase
MKHSPVHQPPPLRDSFVEAMSRAASSVSVITTDGPAGRAGVTVTAMTPVSADGVAPRLLICLNNAGKTCAAILRNRQFCVNLLRDGQQEIARLFARQVGSDEDRRRFAQSWKDMEIGAPRLPDPLAAFSCRISDAQLVGTHHVIFGFVGDVYVADPDPALVYANRRYGTVHD